MATFLSSLEHKSNVEIQNLKRKLKNQLNKDIFRIYSDSIFTDVYISVGDNFVKSHRCLLETRTPTFYHIFTHNPDLISVVPAQKLDFFLREIYCDNRIETIEEELVKCVETAFSSNGGASSPAASGDFELSNYNNYYSVNDDADNDNDQTRSELRRQKSPHLSESNTSLGYTNYDYFRRDNNTVYYSLVDESLLLSDYCDINEVGLGLKEMSGRSGCDDLIRIESSSSSLPRWHDVKKSAASCNAENVEHGLVERSNPNDMSTIENRSHLVTEKKFFDVDRPTTCGSFKFFIDASDLLDSEEAHDDQSSTEQQAESDKPVVKSSNGDNNVVDDQRPADSLKTVLRESNFEDAAAAGKNTSRTEREKRTPDSLDDVLVLPQTSDECSSCQSEPLREKYESDVRAKLPKNFYNAHLVTNGKWTEQKPRAQKRMGMIVAAENVPNLVERERFDRGDTKMSPKNVNDCSQEQLRSLEENVTMECGRMVEEQNTGAVERCLSKEGRFRSGFGEQTITSTTTTIFTTGISTVENEARVIKPIPAEHAAVREATAAVSRRDWARFKMLLTEKYDCAIKNHAYSDDERERLKIFDELIGQDKCFEYLKCNLEEIVGERSNTKARRLAMHKFLVKQYEKKHGSGLIGAFARALMRDILSRRRKYDNDTNANNDDDNDADELLRKLLLVQVPKKATTPTPRKQDVDDDLVTGEPVAGKSCGFFIDLTTTTPTTPTTTTTTTEKAKSGATTNETRHKSSSAIASKQLFSMFIDFGNSTDSDSSIELQNKFERRKKQCIIKLEKSRELRTSTATSLNESSEQSSRKPEKMTRRRSTPPPIGSNDSSVAGKIVAAAEHPPIAIAETLHEMTLSIASGHHTNSGFPHPHEVRACRSWTVGQTYDVDRNLIVAAKHKRSYSSSGDGTTYKATEPPLQSVAGLQNGAPGANGGEDGRNEFPSIANADSTDEQQLPTANGESEMLNSRRSCFENEEYTIGSNERTEEGVGGRERTTYDRRQSRADRNVEEDEEEKKKKKVFVKLSDMDKEPKTVMLANSDQQWSSVRMTKSASGTTETNWFETKLLDGSVNSRSLSRIFPDLSANVLSKPNSDVDDTTVSSISSIQSSSAVSTCGSNPEMSNSATKNNDNNTLGQDLLRMFLDEISTDVVVEVAGRRIKAHKCVLTSRCQYFAALLSGGWVESAGNVLSIQGFSYNVVHFALCYIYSGESEIPENINIVELATLADYLCLEGLKEVVSCTLKMKYCHFFHKPCNVCSVGVLECLPIAVNYGLDDIHRKSLRWITKHYVRLWCSKAFATLPRELIDKCYNQHVVNMTVNNVFETLINCDKLFSFIPQTRWAESCFVVTKKLHDYCVRFLANHFLEFLKSEAFTSIASNRTWGIMIMDEKTRLACGKMRSEQLCQGYAYLNSQCKLATASHENEELIELLNRVKNQVESALVKTALQASQCNAWFQMEAELRNHIQNAAGLTFLPTELKRRVDSFKSRPATVSNGSRDADLQQVKSVINRQRKQNNIRSHEARQTKPNSHQKQSSAQARNLSTSSQNKENKGHKAPTHNNNNNNSKSPFRNKYANVKSRYMDSSKGGGKSDKTASETTPSETSELEKRPSTANKRPSKSLASSVHLSPGIRQTARAVSLSKIPVSVRNSSQKRTESDKDTTSGSDNGFRSERTTRTPRVNGDEMARTNKKLNTTSVTAKCRSAALPSSSRTSQVATRKSFSGSSKSYPADGRSKNDSGSNRTVKSRSATTKHRSIVNGCCGDDLKNGVVSKYVNDSDDLRSKVSSPDTKCPSDPSSKTSLSEEIHRPDIPFRRDGTFCIDEPTVLKKHSPSSDQADIV